MVWRVYYVDRSAFWGPGKKHVLDVTVEAATHAEALREARAEYQTEAGYRLLVEPRGDG